MKLALYTISLRTILASFLFLNVVRADDSENHHHGLGQVRFPVSCTPEAQKTFEHGVALLHSFGYDEAEKTFSRVITIDPACAMAYWGIAMSHYHPVWVPPTPADLRKGMAAVEKANSVGAKTQRERDYLAAMEVFYKVQAKCLMGSVRSPGVTPCNNFRRAIRKITRPPFSLRSP